MTANISYTESHDNYSDSTFSSYGGNKTFEMLEINHLKKKYRSISPSVKYELNSEKVYLKNEVKASISRISANDMRTVMAKN